MIKETKKAEKKDIKQVDPDGDLIAFIQEQAVAGDNYRKKFKDKWDYVEGQIRCEHPADWDKKEDWQTKVFIPQQSKTSESAQAYLDKMLFGQKRFYSIKGVEKQDKEQEGYLGELFDNVMDRGNFMFENDFVLNEACSGPATSFIKLLVNPDRTGIHFIWRSAYNLIIDPECGHKLSNARYIIDEYKKPLAELVSDVQAGKSLYKQEAIQKLIDAGQEAGQRNLSDEALAIVKGFDGTDVEVSQAFVNIKIKEYWGYVKNVTVKENGQKVYRYEDRVVTTGNDVVKMRDVPNEYGFKPFFSARVKPRKYDFYGLGFLGNTTDLQDLTNSMINLGFDSLKMCSMDIAIIDATKVKDASSIDYRPMATWKVKGDPRAAVLLTRQGISALGDIMRGLTMLDQFQQEATGVLRQIQGSPELSGQGSETLGEYQAKLAMIDNRFLKIARFIERDYIEPMLEGIFKILFNTKFFNQATIDRILGLKDVTEKTVNPETGQEQEIVVGQESKLNFKEISEITEMGYDFKAVGMTQFTKSLETLNKLRALLEMVMKYPDLKVISRVEEVFKRVLRSAEIQDYEEVLKSDDEIKQIMSMIYGGQQQQGQNLPQIQ